MKVKTIASALVLAGALSSNQVLADSSKEQDKGAVTGLVVGAIAAGPVGAFAGTVLGAEVFGRLFQQKRALKVLSTEVDQLTAALTSERSQHANTISALNQDLDTLIGLQSGTAKSRTLPIQFRTASSDIEPHYLTELNNLVSVLSRNKDANITITGYADRRGDDQYNHQLSENRVTRVKQYLVRRGVHPSQIHGIAHGESQPVATEESLENNFFDRRVVLELDLNLDPQLATR